jgi:hypothetical protein
MSEHTVHAITVSLKHKGLQACLQNTLIQSLLKCAWQGSDASTTCSGLLTSAVTDYTKADLPLNMIFAMWQRWVDGVKTGKRNRLRKFLRICRQPCTTHAASGTLRDPSIECPKRRAVCKREKVLQT